MSRHEAGWVPDTQPSGQLGKHQRPSAREELQAAIWLLMSACDVQVGNGAVPFVDTLLLLADAYSSGDSETLTKLRREVLHRESRPLA